MPMSLGEKSERGPVLGGERPRLPQRCVPAALLFDVTLRWTGRLVTMSPTRRSRPPELSARWPPWKIAPFGGGGAAGAGAVAAKASSGILSLAPAPCGAAASARIRALESLRRIFHHLVSGLDHLRIDLIGALGLDHVDELLDDVDIRSL